MRQRPDRRTFLGATASAGIGVTLGGALGRACAGAEALKVALTNAKKLGWSLCCQLYTFRDRNFYEAIETIAALGFDGVEPAFFLPLAKGNKELQTNEKLDDAARKELRKRLADLGLAMKNFYGDLGADAADCRRKFDFAKEMGVETFVAEPPPEAFDAIEKLCEEYKINLGVHNHPKSPESRYWQPENVLAAVKTRSKRLGGCCDTGHWVRSGIDPVACLRKMEGRIISMHLKDVAEWGKPEARDVPLGTGRANFAEVLKELRRQKFRGVLTIEYEHLSPELAKDVAQCLTFVETWAKGPHL
ncbi:MAG TPA: endonuclease [Planctomycetes bacterium]|nr:endonuclease [Planctomycetota bacterium]